MRILHFIIPLFAAILLAGCGEDETAGDDMPPSRPRWVDRSADDVYPQRGIRAEPVADERQHMTHLEWYANPEPDVMGYRIYRAPESWNPYRGYAVADLRIGSDIEPGRSRYVWLDNGDSVGGARRELLAPDPETNLTRGYYWTIAAYDTAGNRSSLSIAAYYRLLNNPYNVSVVRDTTNVYSVTWNYDLNPDVLLSFYMLRVYSAVGGTDSVVWWLKTQRYLSRETVFMDFSQSQGPLVAGQTYICQINAIDNRLTESHVDSLAGAAVYSTFVYQN